MATVVVLGIGLQGRAVVHDLVRVQGVERVVAAVEETYDLVDYRDLDTGLFAMNRTVGFTAAIAAQLLLDGTVAERGVISPARDVPPKRVLDELERRGIRVIRGQRAL